MGAFEFCSTGRIVFGRGLFGRIGELAAPLGHRALIVANGSEGLIGRLTEVLSNAGVKAIHWRQRGEPTVEDVDRAVAAARQGDCDLVLGLGGGSAIDAAKAVAGLLANGGSVLDYLEVIGNGQKLTRPALSWIAIPSTAGTGAEVTRNAVVGYPPKRMKASLRSDLLMARIAVVDPELGLSVPPEVTARCGMDALAQLIEGYTSTGAQPITDALALEGIRRAGRSLQRAFLQGSDLDAREDMALAALLSGIVLTSAGLGAVHGLAAPLGAAFPIPHGTACAALLPHVMAANIQALRQADASQPVLERYTTIGRALSGEPAPAPSPAINAGIAFVRDLCRHLHIPPLRQFGLSEADFPTLVALAQKSGSMRYNPIRLSNETLQAVLEQAL
jgi:alcohol dehydrogenase class IV